jgi:predicted nucleic acid-binding protein
VILLDSSIPMYLIGAAHPHKLDAQRLLEGAVSAGEVLLTDAEVLQEICHRYAAIGRREAIQPAFNLLLGVVDGVLAIDLDDAQAGKDILLGYQNPVRPRCHPCRCDETERHRPDHELRPRFRCASGH